MKKKCFCSKEFWQKSQKSKRSLLEARSGPKLSCISQKQGKEETNASIGYWIHTPCHFLGFCSYFRYLHTMGHSRTVLVYSLLCIPVPPAILDNIRVQKPKRNDCIHSTAGFLSIIFHNACRHWLGLRRSPNALRCWYSLQFPVYSKLPTCTVIYSQVANAVSEPIPALQNLSLYAESILNLGHW